VLEAAAILCFAIGLIHSCLGEKFILIRLFLGDKVPHLFGSDSFPKRTLRFVWHITTIAWWGFAYLLWQVSLGSESLSQSVLHTVSLVFFLNGLFAFAFTRGRHLSWIVFWLIAGLSYFVATNH